ncbi:hypothetical protein ACQ4PT_061908 [Festuca glaucescens]
MSQSRLTSAPNAGALHQRAQRCPARCEDAAALHLSYGVHCNRTQLDDVLLLQGGGLASLHTEGPLFYMFSHTALQASELFVMSAIDTDTPKVYFVSGHGGTRKTFLWNCIVTVLRSECRIMLDVASSGVASLLLPNGRTAHSRFRIPLDVNDKTRCNISRGSTMAALLEKTSLILWDEGPMKSRYCFEALDHTLRDVLSANDSARSSLPFGGKTVILGGDSRQVLPVVEGGFRNELIDASLIASPLRRHVTVLNLKENTCLKRPDLSSADREELSAFARWVLDVGNGDILGHSKDGEDSGSWITIPEDPMLRPASNNVDAAIGNVYDSFFL